MLVRSPTARLGAGVRARLLLHRHRLAGERRLLDLEVDGLDEPGVGGDPVARVSRIDVAGHQLARRDLVLLAVAQDGRGGGGHLPQRLHAPLGAVLLDEAQQRREQHDHGDGDGLEPWPSTAERPTAMSRMTMRTFLNCSSRRPRGRSAGRPGARSGRARQAAPAPPRRSVRPRPCEPVESPPRRACATPTGKGSGSRRNGAHRPRSGALALTPFPASERVGASRRRSSARATAWASRAAVRPIAARRSLSVFSTRTQPPGAMSGLHRAPLVDAAARSVQILEVDGHGPHRRPNRESSKATRRSTSLRIFRAHVHAVAANVDRHHFLPRPLGFPSRCGLYMQARREPPTEANSFFRHDT